MTLLLQAAFQRCSGSSCANDDLRDGIEHTMLQLVTNEHLPMAKPWRIAVLLTG